MVREGAQFSRSDILNATVQVLVFFIFLQNMSENSSDSDSVIDVDDNELLFEDEGISTAFLETLEALEENTLEFDLELTDAITEVNLSILKRILVGSD